MQTLTDVFEAWVRNVVQEEIAAAQTLTTDQVQKLIDTAVTEEVETALQHNNFIERSDLDSIIEDKFDDLLSDMEVKLSR